MFTDHDLGAARSRAALCISHGKLGDHAVIRTKIGILPNYSLASALLIYLGLFDKADLSHMQQPLLLYTLATRCSCVCLSSHICHK
jgi:hypothetical protein